MRFLIFLQHLPHLSWYGSGSRHLSFFTHHVQAIGKSCHWYLQNTSFFLTTSTAITLIQDISHLDHCNSLLKCFPRFSSSTFDLLLTCETSFSNKIQIFHFFAPNLLKTYHLIYSKIQSPSNGLPRPWNLTIIPSAIFPVVPLCLTDSSQVGFLFVTETSQACSYTLCLISLCLNCSSSKYLHGSLPHLLFISGLYLNIPSKLWPFCTLDHCI